MDKTLRKGLSLIGALVVASGSIAVLAGSVTAQTKSLSLARNFRPDPIELAGSAGGGKSIPSLAGMQGRCRGFSNQNPNHVVQLTEDFPLVDMLVHTPNINADLTLLVKGDNGLVICADDEYRGRNPQITRRLSQGNYQIWVGTGNANQSVNYTLSISEIAQK
ncbi:hypothetical protein Pse7367_2928 [Thalassoporum mexicanum PCC 7367]|uniref:hypothetical protein n=1 Tax=Thalassoporum mexicanum TaxID=3457544 RepID=UPI00029FF52C|nr:hypothetical protein [Pseudanabaena sp. PCC 7367]AFY71180.1 hypothetical protein Pse7367_2928 [Pseudanabaena sp. PCC 7367]